MICDECRTPNPESASFCLSCGVRLHPGVARPVAERRLIHVVFCDLVGSTPLSEQLDPEDLRRLLQHFQSLCADAVAHFEGHLAQFLGDGALIYFGYPRAHEDDAQRAVRAALQIVRAVSRGPVVGQRMQVRVGVHSGIVVVGEVGVVGHRAELAVGETPAVAERIQAEAEPDTVVITDATERLVRGFFATEELGVRSLRGLAKPMRLFEVGGESGARNRLEAARTTGLTPFVARADEMAMLLGRWKEARLGRGSVVLIQGEAGVGKSRLVEACKVNMAEERLAVIQGSCAEYLRNTAFHPIASALEYEMHQTGALAPARRSDWVEYYAARFRLSPSDAARVLQDLLSVPLGDGTALAESSSARKRQLATDALSRWLLHVEDESPKLIILEDLHWADASTLELLAAVAERAASCRLLVILTFRPELRLPDAVIAASTILSLRPLERADAYQLALNVAGGKPLPIELTLRLDEWTKGVPLYIEELVKGLLESGTLVESGDRFELAEALPRDAVPETLAGPLTARIDQLSTAKPVAQWASVLGHEFRYDMLAAISGVSPQRLKEAVDRLAATDIVVERSGQPGVVYRFRHALLRDAAYKSLLLTDRRAIHRRTVEALQSQFQDFAHSRPELVAYHAAEAGLAELAVCEWQRASEKALAAAANWEALAHVEEGVQQLAKLPEGRERHERELAFELVRGPALMAVKGYQAPEVEETYRRARSLCETLGDPSRLYFVLWGLWANQFVAGELGAARAFGEQVLRVAERAGDAALLVPAYHALGYTLCYTANFERSLELARAGISLFDMDLERRNVQSFQFSSTVALHHFAAVCLWMLGFADQACAQAREAVELARALGHPPTLAYAQSALTWGAPFLVGDAAAVESAGREAMELSRDEKFSLWPLLVQVFRGWSEVAAGDTASGLANMRMGYAAFCRSGGGILRTTMRVITAQAKHKACDAAGALEVISDALSDIASTHEHNYEPELHRIRGEVLASAESGPLRSDQEAEASLRAALRLAREQQARALELRAALSLHAYLRDRGRPEEGRALVQRAYDSFTEGWETPDLRAARAAIG
ncbi:MAG: AAA family ATPase [Polyangiaceae bacterium]